MDSADAVRRRDAQRAFAGARGLRPAMPRASKLGRAIAGFITEGAPGVPASRLLLLEPMHFELVDVAASLARRVDIVATCAGAREALREHCDRHNIEGELRVRLPAASPAWSAAIADFSAARGGDAVEPALRELHARLAPSAPLWIVLPYEFLEYSRGNVVAHPITELRRLLAAGGFGTERLKPIDEDAHVLVAHARHRASTENAA